jgi:hypothetical protein
MKPEPCRCNAPNAGCRRAGRPMTGRLWELCSGTNCSAELSERYRAKWDGLPVPPRTVTETPAVLTETGTGTQLARLLRRFGIDSSPGCKCRRMAAKMDAMGPAWCESEQGMAEILEAMRTEAGKRGLPFLDAVGKMLVRQAVRSARRETERAEKASEAQSQGPPAV